MTTMQNAPAPAPAYPVRVDATLERGLSRWLWLVKWLLAVPHYIVLAFLWVAFAVFSVAAFFAILFTGRYPRVLFDFNVGVMRWTWRVAYYSCGVLGTDRYPPFSLREVSDYPAHLDVPYPERLSRGLVLVKWWLLAIPHYLIVGLFVGGGAWALWQFGPTDGGVAGGGLIGVLVLIAAVSLLFRGRYPLTIFDLVLGLNRWALRVAAYAALMTDSYPPFRLDQGGSDPGTLMASPPPPAPPAAPPPAPPDPQTVPWQAIPPSAPPARSGWTAGRIASAVVGAVAILASVGLLVAGAVGLTADQVLRDDDGYLTAGSRGFTTSTHALTTDSIDLHDIGWSNALSLSQTLGEVRIRATGSDDARVFVGIAPTAVVRDYLSGSAYATIDDPADSPVAYTVHDGSATPAKPASQTFWAAQSTGRGEQSVVWPARSGDWAIVVMNASAAEGVTATADIGATLPGLTGLAVGLLIAGAVLLAIGVLIVYVAARRARTRPSVDAPPLAGGPPVDSSPSEGSVPDAEPTR
jgi:hypothetical protein